MVLLKQFFQAPPVLDAAHRRAKLQRGKPFPQLLLDLIERGLGLIEPDQHARTVPGDLAAQLAADRAAGSGDQNGAACQVFPKVALLPAGRRTSQQIFETDLADLLDEHARTNALDERGHALDGNACSLALFENRGELIA